MEQTPGAAESPGHETEAMQCEWVDRRPRDLGAWARGELAHDERSLKPAEAWARIEAQDPEFLKSVELPDGIYGCWLWIGKAVGGRGYLVDTDSAFWKAHRLAYLFAHGVLPEGWHVCHSCDRSECVNPTHLWLGTGSDNMQDAARKERMNQPSGDQHWTRINPERRARGASHGDATRAGQLSSGAAHKISEANRRRFADPAARVVTGKTTARGMLRGKLERQVAASMFPDRNPLPVGDALDCPRAQRPRQLLVPDSLWGNKQKRFARAHGFFPSLVLPGHGLGGDK